MDIDPRLATKLPTSAILTDTKLRLSFVPLGNKEKVIAAEVSVRKTKIDELTVAMRSGHARIQIKAGFGLERDILLTPVEMFLISEIIERVLVEMPG